MLGVEVLLEGDAELLAEGLELLEVLVVLALGVDLGLDACGLLVHHRGKWHVAGRCGFDVPSKMRTAVAKSLTRRAALRAAAMTEGEGTRS